MSWSVSEAKARLSEVLARARRAPQVIENRGEEVAVVLSVAEFERLRAASAAPRPTPLAALVDLAERLKSEGALSFELPERKLEPGRPAPFDENG